MIKLINIEKIYGKEENRVNALKAIDLKIEKGEIIAIMGVSGSGKSTLLNILGCIDRPTSGKYLLNDEDVSTFNHFKLAKYRNRHFGFVIQNFALIDDYTAYENIIVPLNYTKLKNKEKKDRIHTIAENLGIYDKLDKLPSQLSGGQNQRVAIARALVNKPEIILADEPTGSLDQKTGQEIMNLLINLNQEGKTVIIVTHDPKVADYCHRTIFLEDGFIKE